MHLRAGQALGLYRPRHLGDHGLSRFLRLQICPGLLCPARPIPKIKTGVIHNVYHALFIRIYFSGNTFSTKPSICSCRSAEIMHPSLRYTDKRPALTTQTKHIRKIAKYESLAFTKIASCSAILLGVSSPLYVTPDTSKSCILPLLCQQRQPA